MSKKDIITYDWDEATGIATCTIFGSINGLEKKYVGVAHTHPEDEDMKSELVGAQIAEWRAQIELIKDYIASELKPGLAALKQLYYSMNRSKHYNMKSYESKMLYRQIRQKEEDIENAKLIIFEIRRYIAEYIARKETNYQLIRKKRNNK